MPIRTAKKPFKYYAIRVGNSVIFRRTVGTLQKVRSILYKPRTEFKLEQITYTGGKIIGCMSHIDWYNHMNKNLNSITRLTREQYRALDPYIYKDERPNGH